MTVRVSRRQFLKFGAAGVGASSMAMMGFAPDEAVASIRHFKLTGAKVTRNICTYCSVGCGMLLYARGDGAANVVDDIYHVEGDPDHPINRGTLCPKGASLQQDIVNERRLLKPQVRRPGSDHWEDIDWDAAVDEIARQVKKTRDATFTEKDDRGRTVNRCEGIAWTGGCTDTNELNYLVVKTMRSLGVVFLENQARV